MNVLQVVCQKPHVYKRLSTDSRFQWPRSEDELKEITPQQFKWLMEGLSIAPKKKIKELTFMIVHYNATESALRNFCMHKHT